MHVLSTKESVESWGKLEEKTERVLLGRFGGCGQMCGQPNTMYGIRCKDLRFIMSKTVGETYKGP